MIEQGWAVPAGRVLLIRHTALAQGNRWGKGRWPKSTAGNTGGS